MRPNSRELSLCVSLSLSISPFFHQAERDGETSESHSHTGALCASGCPELHLCLSPLSLYLHFTISHSTPSQCIYFAARVKRLRKKQGAREENFFYCVRTWRWRRKAANPSCWPSGKGRHIYSKLNHSPRKCTSSSGRGISALRNKYSKAPCKLLFNALDFGSLFVLQVLQKQETKCELGLS